MNILKDTDTTTTTTNSIIISKDVPIEYEGNKKIIFEKSIDDIKVKEEIIEFISRHNKTTSGNTTLLSMDELERYIRLGSRWLLMRSDTAKRSLIGIVMSLPLPIKVKDGEESKIITHGYTTFLNVHNSLRGHGLCMAMIRELIQDGYKDGIYCDYHLVPDKIGENSLLINSWYRPLNLKSCVDVGFIYPGYNDPRSKVKNRLKYSTRLNPNIETILVDKDSAVNVFCFYKQLVDDKEFAFYPELDFWLLWIEEFPTYLIKDIKTNKDIGIFSLGSVSVKIESVNKIANLSLPVLAVATDANKLLNAIIHESSNLGYDALYIYELGDFSSGELERIHSLKTTVSLYFSMYNNNSILNKEGIITPII